jgi:hypothetical protein
LGLCNREDANIALPRETDVRFRGYDTVFRENGTAPFKGGGKLVPFAATIRSSIRVMVFALSPPIIVNAGQTFAAD